MRVNDNMKRKSMAKRWALKLGLAAFDIFAVNFSYFMALVLRFYVNSEFHPANKYYVPLFAKFAPYYTVCCIIIFVAFRLYSGMLRYAGLNDVNRVVCASAATCAVQVFGTLLFVGRMPITYYVLGALIQFALLCVSRFSYRIFAIEFLKHAKERNASIKTLIIGTGETARTLLRQLEGEKENLIRPVCVLDCRNSETGRLYDGLPVLGGLEGIRQAVEQYGVKSAIIADVLLPAEEKEKIKEFCKSIDLEVQDFLPYTNSFSRGLLLQQLLEYTTAPLVIGADGQSRTFENAEQAFSALQGKYLVRSVGAAEGRLRIEAEKDASVPNSTSEAWARDYADATGEELSFF